MSNLTTFIGVRMAGPADYTPAYLPAGASKPVRQKAVFNVYENLPNDQTSRFKITAWGKNADSIAKYGAPGKELTMVCDINSYKGRVSIKNANGQYDFVLDSTGQPALIEKVGFIARNLHFGEDGDKQIAFEIQNRMRPPLWSVNGHPDNVEWKNICAQRKAQVFVPGATNFGFAKIAMPHNGQLVDQSAFNKNTAYAPVNPNVGTAQYTQPQYTQPQYPQAPVYAQPVQHAQQSPYVQTPQYQPAPQYQQVPAQMNNQYGPATQFVGNPGQVGNVMPPQAPVNTMPQQVPVMVHGQNMGYAPPVGAGNPRM